MYTAERRAHARAQRLSAQRPDDYYVMRDDCYEPDQPEAFYVLSGSQWDVSGAPEGCEPIACYCEGERQRDY